MILGAKRLFGVGRYSSPYRCFFWNCGSAQNRCTVSTAGRLRDGDPVWLRPDAGTREIRH